MAIELDQNASHCSHSLYEPPQEIDYGGAPLWMPTKTPEYDVAAMILKKGCKPNNQQMEDVCIDEVLQRPILCIPPKMIDVETQPLGGAFMAMGRRKVVEYLRMLVMEVK